MTDEGARFRLMFERSADAILLLDTAANLFVEYNQAALDMLRCTRQELSALHPSILSPPTQPDGKSSFSKANEMIATAIQNGSHRFEWIHRSPHRDDFPVEVLLTPLPLGDASIVVVVWRDITERLRSEEALRQAQRLESLAVLAGGIAHDFNNLLAAMSGHLHAVREAHGDAATAEHVEQIEHAVTKAASLTRQLLAYGGRGTVAIETLDLRALVREIIDLLRISTPQDVSVVCQFDDDVAPVDADRAQIQQIVMNLVTNAGEAMADAGGTLTVRVLEAEVSEADLTQDFPGQALQAGPVVCLEVADTGSGMTPEVKARIFEPFFTTKASGRGLGLSALRGILRAHHGGASLESAPGHGTTFRICLPANRTVAAPSPGAHAVAAHGEGIVLIVDDEATVRRSLSLLVRSLGFDVIEAAGGLEAVEAYRARGAEIAWVLMDLTMPQMDGHAALLELRKLDPDVVVVLCSGWAEEEVISGFADHPPSGFVPKPFTRRELEAVLERVNLVH